MWLGGGYLPSTGWALTVIPAPGEKACSLSSEVVSVQTEEGSSIHVITRVSPEIVGVSESSQSQECDVVTGM